MIKSLRSLLLSGILILQQLVVPLAPVLAQEAEPQSTVEPSPSSDPVSSPSPTTEPTPSSQPSSSPTPTSSPEPSPTIEPTPSPTASPASPEPTATPTPTPSVTPSPSPSSTPTASDSAQPTVNTAAPNNPTDSQTDSSQPGSPSTSNQSSSSPHPTANNSTASTSPSPSPAPHQSLSSQVDDSTTATVSATTGSNTSEAADTAEMATGGAYSQLDLIQILNSLIFDSSFEIITYDLTDPHLEVLDLTQLAQLPPGSETYGYSCPTGTCGPSSQVSNSASTSADLTVQANTGDNQLEAEDTDLETGDATALANVVQVVNTELHHSSIAIVIINILVPWGGDIWLPTPPGQPSTTTALTAGSTQGSSTTNDATVNTNINLDANTGNNTQTGGDNSLLTGDALASLYYQLFANNTYVDQSLWQFFIQNSNSWGGGVAEGVASNPEVPENDLNSDSDEALTSNQDQPSGEAQLDNQATLGLNLNLLANTGNNQTSGTGSHTMTTGQATALANVIQMVNTRWFNSQLFLGIVNVIQPWFGNVWLGQPPEEPAVGGPIVEEYEEASEPERIIAETASDPHMPHVNITLAGPTEAVEAGDQIQFVAQLHNDSDTTVEQPILEQALVNSEGQKMGMIRFQLPPIPAGKKANFRFVLKVPTNGAKGVYTSELLLKEAKVGLAPVSNVASADFTVIGWLATQVLVPAPVEARTSSVLGVETSMEEALPSQRFFKPEWWMLIPMAAALFLIKKSREKLAES